MLPCTMKELAVLWLRSAISSVLMAVDLPVAVRVVADLPVVAPAAARVDLPADVEVPTGKAGPTPWPSATGAKIRAACT